MEESEMETYLTSLMSDAEQLPSNHKRSMPTVLISDMVDDSGMIREYGLEFIENLSDDDAIKLLRVLVAIAAISPEHESDTALFKKACNLDRYSKGVLVYCGIGTDANRRLAAEMLGSKDSPLSDLFSDEWESPSMQLLHSFIWNRIHGEDYSVESLDELIKRYNDEKPSLKKNILGCALTRYVSDHPQLDCIYRVITEIQCTDEHVLDGLIEEAYQMAYSIRGSDYLFDDEKTMLEEVDRFIINSLPDWITYLVTSRGYLSPSGFRIAKIIDADDQCQKNRIELVQELSYESVFEGWLENGTRTFDDCSNKTDQSTFAYSSDPSESDDAVEYSNRGPRTLMEDAYSGDDDAQYDVALLFLKEKDRSDEGLRWMLLSASNGNIEAQLELGRMYIEGQYVEPSTEMGIRWLSSAACQGDLESLTRIATILSKSNDDKNEGLSDRLRAICVWIGAMHDDRESQYALSEMYWSGTGLDRSIDQSIRWLKESANNEFVKAQMTLASRYNKGEGVPQSKDMAFDLYISAAENGDPSAPFFALYILDKNDLSDRDEKWSKCVDLILTNQNSEKENRLQPRTSSTQLYTGIQRRMQTERSRRIPVMIDRPSGRDPFEWIRPLAADKLRDTTRARIRIHGSTVEIETGTGNGIGDSQNYVSRNQPNNLARRVFLKRSPRILRAIEKKRSENRDTDDDSEPYVECRLMERGD